MSAMKKIVATLLVSLFVLVQAHTDAGAQQAQTVPAAPTDTASSFDPFWYVRQSGAPGWIER